MSKFNVYHAPTATGPWTLANPTPLDAAASGHNTYTVSGLDHAANYFIAVIGGVEQGGQFFAFANQPIGPLAEGILEIGALRPESILARTFSPTVSGIDSLGHEFGVV